MIKKPVACGKCPMAGKLSSPEIVRILKKDQREVLMSKIRNLSGKKCECGERDWRFGFVYLRDSLSVVNGFTVECQECGNVVAYCFEPLDSLTLVMKHVPQGDVVVSEG